MPHHVVPTTVGRMIDPLAAALAVVLARLPGPYTPPDRSETAAAERAAFLPVLAEAEVSAAREATCTGPWAEIECRRRWPGPPDELVSLTSALGYWESRLDARIQSGHCGVWGPSPSQIECDGVLFRSGMRPPNMRGLSKRTRWGLVVFRSSTLFQLQGLSDDRLREVVGVAPMNLFESSRLAIAILAGARSTCRERNWATCVVSSFAGTISFKQAPARVATFEKVLRELRSEVRKSAPAAV